MPRSHTEQLWIDWFTAQRVQWEYEPQTFYLPAGRYTPDFYIPAKAAWVEIKHHYPAQRPRIPDGAHKALELAKWLQAVAPWESVVLVAGWPPPGYWYCWIADPVDGWVEYQSWLATIPRLPT